MVSRETTVQGGVGVGAVAMFLVVPTVLDLPFYSLGGVLATILLDVTIVGGAHLYLALRGDDEGFPVRARWRTVALVTELGAVAFLANAMFRLTMIPDRWIRIGAITIAVVSIAVYWYVEARDGYRNSRSTDQGTI